MHTLIQLDQSLSASYSQFTDSHTVLAKLSIALGVGLVYLVPLILAFAWFAVSRKAALKAAITGLLAWEGLSKLVAHFVPRARPALSQIGTKELIFHRPDTSFPSDHSAFLMAVALSLYLSGQKKLGHVVLIIAILTGITRVGIGVHFPGDILAGWLVGAITVGLLRLIDQPLDKYLIEPLITFARKFRL